MVTKQDLKLLQQRMDNDIAAMLLAEKTLSIEEIARRFGVSSTYVTLLARARKIKRPQGAASPAYKMGA